MKIGIGTAQFGMRYGLTNHADQTDLYEAEKIIETAQKHGIHIIDTAKAYGNSEQVLGRILPKSHYFDIITKIPILTEDPNVSKTLKTQFFDSLTKLNMSSIYSLLLHNPADLFSPFAQEIYSVLSNLKEKGLIKKIGISVYDQYEMEKVIEKYHVDLVQVPLNIFDQRLIQTSYLKALHKLGIEIHARSIFLQGLLLEDPAKLPSFFDPIKNNIFYFQEEMKRRDISLVDAALNFILNIEEIDHVIIGVNNSMQLKQIIQGINKKMDRYDFSNFAINNEKFIKPTNWEIS